jgi:hypothetical protein
LVNGRSRVVATLTGGNPMSRFSKKFSFAVLFLTALCLIPVSAQTTKVDHTASVGGRVTVKGQPAAGVSVILLAGQRQGMRDEPLARATTDAEGRFQMSHIAAGSYRVNLSAPGYINADEDNPRRGEQTVNVEENDAIDNLNFSLKRGGVITGTVTDAAHQPLIDASVRLGTVGTNGQVTFGYQYSGETDDRGVYRIFGLPSGRYKVSVKDSGRQIVGDTLNQGTYYPNTREEAKAKIVEVPDGGEVTDIDIRVGEMPKTYSIYGRMIDAESGKPIVGLRYGIGEMMPNESQSGNFTIPGSITDAKGEFKVGGLVAGRYAVFAYNVADSNVYSEPVIVEISNADAKIEIKTRNGASINGYVIVEGTNDAKILQQLSQYYISFHNPAQRNMPGQSIRLDKPDRSFHFSGLRPGNVEPNVGGFGNNTFTVSRLEKDGVEVKSIEVHEGEQVNNVNVYLSYNKGVIRGQVRVESGDFPDLSGLYVFATRKGDPPGRGYRQYSIDSRGRFVMEGVAPGEYVLSLGAVNRKSAEALARMQRLTPQTVTVTNDAESQVTFVLQTRN